MARKFVMPLVLCVAVSVFSGVSCGDTTPNANTMSAEVTGEKQLPKSQPVVKHVIKLNNVRPGMMAYWLDPEHHPVPFEQQTSEARDGGAAGQFRNPYTMKSALEPSSPGSQTASRGRFSLQDGVDAIIAVDSQHVLLVYGTEEGVRKFEQLVKVMDRPIQQVQLDVRFVEMSAEAIKTMRIDFGSSTGPFAKAAETFPRSGTFGIGRMPQQSYSTLDNLIKQGLARQLGSGSINTPNNMQANISLRTTTKGTSSNKIPVTVDIHTQVTPTINADGTVTVLFRPELSWQSDGTPSNARVQTVANVKDGDTIVLAGLTLLDKDKPLVAFIKTMIIRPAEAPQIP